MTYKKKLIEVTLPLEGDQQESVCKKMSGFGVIIVNMLRENYSTWEKSDISILH